MPHIILGYGDFSGHTIVELPKEVLKELSERFPLESEKYNLDDPQSLLFAVAIHEEIRRREAGGQIKKRIPTPRELAQQLVNQGFRQLSKVHHPDRNGASDAQRRLTEVRDRLIIACQDVPDEDCDALRIPPPAVEISDEDIPF
jgi:hypothetical protein